MRLNGRDLAAAIVRRLLARRFIRFLARVQCLRLVEVGTASRVSSELLAMSEAVCSVPIYSDGGGTAEKLFRTFPPLRLWDIRNGQVSLNHRFAAVAQDGTLLINDRIEPPPFRAFRPGAGAYRTGNIVGQFEDLVYVKAFSGGFRVDSVIYVGTRATYNLSHFLVDFLPGLYVVNRFGHVPKHVPVVVPKNVLHDNHFRSLFELVAEGREILAIGEDEVVKADRVFWVDPPAYGGPFTGQKDLRQPLVWHREAMAHYRDFLLKSTGPISVPPNSSRSRRIFIVRPDGKRSPQIANLEGTLRDFGFDVVDMAALHLREKLELLDNVSHIVAPAGSGLANLIFARPGVKVLAFTLNKAPYFDNFVPNLVELAEGKLTIFAAQNKVSLSSSDRYEIPEEHFRAQLEAFVQSK